MSEAHAFCAPSDYEGWSNCPGKPAMEEAEPEQESSYAAEGTLGHDLAARSFRGESVDFPPELSEGLNRYLAGIHATVQAFKDAGATVEVFIEQRLDISQITTEKNARGTADCIIIAYFKNRTVLVVRDLKLGTGVEVEPENNGQLMIYALAAVLKFQLMTTFDEVVISIHQPRLFAEPKDWNTTVEALREFGHRAQRQAFLALSLRGSTEALEHLVPGPVQCRWCRAKYRCPALTEQVYKDVMGDLEDLNDPQAKPVTPMELTADPGSLALRLSLAMTRIPMIEDWITAVRAQTEKELIAGRAVPGFKLVEGRLGVRKFRDIDTAQMILLKDGQTPEKIFEPRTLKSPTQLEAFLNGTMVWETLQQLIERKPGKPSVAPESDKRPVYTGTLQSDLDSMPALELGAADAEMTSELAAKKLLESLA